MPRPALRSWALACALTLGLGARATQAQAPRLTWSAPPSCPSQAQLEQRLQELLRHSDADLSRLSGRALVSTQGSGYTLRLSLRVGERAAARTLQGESCDALAQAAAWLMAVALDPELAFQLPPSSPASTAVAAEAVPVGAAPSAAAPPARDPSAAGPGTAKPEHAPGASARRPSKLPLWWRTGLFSGVWSAGLPGAQASLGGRVGMGFGLGYVELRAAQMFATSVQEQSAEVSLATQELVLGGCVQWGRRLRGGPCLTLAGLRTHADVRGISDPDDETIWWATAGAGANLGWLVRAPLELQFEAGAALPLTPRPRFLIEGVDEIVRAWPVSAYGQLGIAVRLE